MSEYRLIFMTGKGTRKGPSFDTKKKAFEYGEKVRNLYGCDFKIRKVVTE